MIYCRFPPSLVLNGLATNRFFSPRIFTLAVCRSRAAVSLLQKYLPAPQSPRSLSCLPAAGRRSFMRSLPSSTPGMYRAKAASCQAGEKSIMGRQYGDLRKRPQRLVWPPSKTWLLFKKLPLSTLKKSLLPMNPYHSTILHHLNTTRGMLINVLCCHSV